MKTLQVSLISAILGMSAAFGVGQAEMLAAKAAFRRIRCEVHEQGDDKLAAFMETGFDTNARTLRVLFKPQEQSVISMSFSIWQKGKQISPSFVYKGVIASGELALFDVPMPKDIDGAFLPEDECIIRAKVAFK